MREAQGASVSVVRAFRWMEEVPRMQHAGDRVGLLGRGFYHWRREFPNVTHWEQLKSKTQEAIEFCDRWSEGDASE
jgi:hypothetical protein